MVDGGAFLVETVTTGACAFGGATGVRFRGGGGATASAGAAAFDTAVVVSGNGSSPFNMARTLL